MKMKKINLSDMKGKLSRAEMKNVMAGSGYTGASCWGGPGTWYYTSTVSYCTCWTDILTYCPSGMGGCY